MILIFFLLFFLPTSSFYKGYGFNFYHKRPLSLDKNIETSVNDDNGKKLELLVDFVIEALPDIVAPLAWDLKDSDINLSSPIWRKESTLNDIHRNNKNSKWCRQDLINAYWRIHYPSIIDKIKVLVDDNLIYISYPNDFDSVMGATEINPIAFVEQVKDKDKFDQVIHTKEKVIPDETSGYFPKKSTSKSESWKETVEEEMKSRDRDQNKASSSSNSGSVSSPRPKSTLDSGYHPEKEIPPLATDWDFKPTTLRNLKKKLKSRKKYFK